MVDVNKGSLTTLNVFETLCNKLACVVYSRTDGDKKILSHILDSLNALDYNLFHFKKERGVLLINQCCYLIPPDETSLALKAITLFTNLIFKGCTIVEGKTLSLALDWCLQCLKCGNQVVVLKCLQALAKGNGKKVEEQNNHVLTDIIKLSENFTFRPASEEVCLNCLRYVEAITCQSNDNNEALIDETILQYFEIFKNILFKGKSSDIQNEILFCKFLITAMRGISNLLQMSDVIITRYLGEILGIIKGYMLYGLLGHENYKIQKLFPTATTVPEVLKSSLQSVRKLRGKYDRRSKKITLSSLNSVDMVGDCESHYVGYSEKNHQINTQLINSMLQTSDSDFSDNEFTHNTKVKSYENKVRHCALILLGTVVEKTNPKMFIAYLPSFLPDGPNFLHMRTLITCLMEDQYSKCRSEAVRVLLIIISNSRQYFQQADGMSKSSFTTFSCTISNTLKELHKCLLESLKNEKNLTTLKNILKCISDLIRCTPYHKVDSSLLTKIVNTVEPFLKHKDVNVQIFSLAVFGCLISVEPKCKEVDYIVVNTSNTSRLLINENENNNLPIGVGDLDIYEEEESDPVEEKPWLLTHCLNNLMTQNNLCDATTNVALQVESLQVIGALSRNFFRETIVNFPEDIITLLKHGSNRDEYLIRLYSGKLMETVLNSLQFGFSSDDESRRAPISLATRLWETFIPGPITSLIQNQDEPMLRCTGCDCLANVGIQGQNSPACSVQTSLIFDQLSRDKQIICVTLLFSCLRDESPAVRSSAARALAIFVMFPSLKQDSLFLLDVIDATTTAAKDDENTVRTQASWLFGNLSEAIISNREKDIDDGVTAEIILRLLRTGIALADNGPKGKPGAVRGIGNLLKIINGDFIQENRDVVVDSLETLIKNATTGTFMKARWNSCYAIANILQNPLIHSNSEWMIKIFNVMTSLVQHYKNFKVRISAGLVLAVPPTRESYGDYYNTVWSAALNALENSKNISDFNEYQHRDQLVDQICIILCHLAGLLDPRDLNSLQDVLYFHLDNLNHFMTKFQERLVPEKSNILLSASAKINSLSVGTGLTSEERSLLRVLQNLFLYEH